MADVNITPVTPSFTTGFTAGSIIFSSGTALTEDNSNFFWNNTTKHLTVAGVTATISLTGDGSASAPARSYTSDSDTGAFRIGANNEGFSAGGTLRWDYNTSRISSTIPILLPDGTAGSPSVSFANQTALGLFRYASNVLAIQNPAYSGGSPIIAIQSTGLTLGASASLIWSSTADAGGAVDDLILSRDAANVLALRNGANEQEFRLGPSGTYSSIKSSAGTIQFQVNTGFTVWQILSNGNLVSFGNFTFGYASGIGAGGAVTQITNKATGVTLNNVTGEITMNGAALAADTTISFTLTNSKIAAGDYVPVYHVSAGTQAAYNCTALAAAGSATINVRNVTPGSLSEAIVLKFCVIKAATT